MVKSLIRLAFSKLMFSYKLNITVLQLDILYRLGRLRRTGDAKTNTPGVPGMYYVQHYCGGANKYKPFTWNVSVTRITSTTSTK